MISDPRDDRDTRASWETKKKKKERKKERKESFKSRAIRQTSRILVALSGVAEVERPVTNRGETYFEP